MKLFLIRHADPDYPNNTITPTGHIEAAALAKYLQNCGIDTIYSSPMERALHTAEYTSKLLGIDIQIEPWMKETNELKVSDPDLPCTKYWDLPGEMVRAELPVPTQTTWDKAWYIKHEKVKEKFEEIKASSDEFLAGLGYVRQGGRYRCVQPNQRKIAVFTHAALYMAWMAHLLELPLTLMWCGFWPMPSSITTMLFEQRSKEWAVPRCIGFGDVSPLLTAGLPVQIRGLQGNIE